MSQDLPKKLPSYERITAVTLFIFIFCLAGFNYYLDEGALPTETDDPHHLVNPLIEVTIKGAVAHPGVYQVKKGTSIAEAVKMAVPKESANLKGINPDTKITRRRTITVKERLKAKG